MIEDGELLGLYIKHLKTNIRANNKLRPVYYGWKDFERWGEFLAEANTPIDHAGRKVWIWSDAHFGHRNIIRYSERPFSDTTKMFEVMLANHNQLVGPDDIVYWLGDFGFGPDSRLNELLAQFNGHKVLILGNHDNNHGEVRRLDFDEVYVAKRLVVDGVQLYLTHYPMRGLPKDIINVHGHEHNGGRYYTGPQHINVNCEFWNYTPADIGVIVDIARSNLARIADK